LQLYAVKIFYQHVENFAYVFLPLGPVFNVQHAEIPAFGKVGLIHCFFFPPLFGFGIDIMLWILLQIPVSKVQTYGDLCSVLMKRIFLSALHFRINTRYKVSAGHVIYSLSLLPHLFLSFAFLLVTI
jgi:hypothetical protein